MLFRYFLLVCLGSLSAFGSVAITGKVVEVSESAQVLDVQIVRAEGNAIPSGEIVSFKVSPGDYEIAYLGRGIRGKAALIQGHWHLGQVFPASGADVSKMNAINRGFIEYVEALPRGAHLQVGDLIPDFAMFDQGGAVFPVRELRGSPFVVNFIFVRCGVPNMCPASSQRMAEMQERARELELDNLEFITVSFDPAFDSPGILRGYGESYGFGFENFRLLTAPQEVIDQLLKVFGILTVEEDGTINHTISTVLVDADGIVAVRQEGPDWSIDVFLDAVSKF